MQRNQTKLGTWPNQPVLGGFHQNWFGFHLIKFGTDKFQSGFKFPMWDCPPKSLGSDPFFINFYFYYFRNLSVLSSIIDPFLPNHQTSHLRSRQLAHDRSPILALSLCSRPLLWGHGDVHELRSWLYNSNLSGYYLYGYIIQV